MEQPIEPIDPNTLHTRLRAGRLDRFFHSDEIKPEILERLRSIDTSIVLPNGTVREISVGDAIKYLEINIATEESMYPDKDEFGRPLRYNATITHLKRVAKDRRNWINQGNAYALIRTLLDDAVHNWNVANGLDEIANQRTPEEKEILDKARKENREGNIRALQDGTEAGIPDKLLFADGSVNRAISQELILAAAAIAKAEVNGQLTLPSFHE